MSDTLKVRFPKETDWQEPEEEIDLEERRQGCCRSCGVTWHKRSIGVCPASRPFWVCTLCGAETF